MKPENDQERAVHMALRMSIQRRDVVMQDRREQVFAQMKPEVMALSSGVVFGQDAILLQQVKQQLVAAINVASIATQSNDPAWIEMSNQMVELVVKHHPQLAKEVAMSLNDVDLIRQIDGYTESSSVTLAHRLH